MDTADGVTLSELTSRLFADGTELRERLLASVDPTGLQAGSVAKLKAAAGWPGVRDSLDQIISERKPTLVYGDYDVDGIVSTYLMYRWLRAHDVPGNCFIPNRMRHGYGLDIEVVKQAVSQGYQALVVLDCGTANLDEVGYAVDAGLQVVIIDHHKSKPELPDAPLLNHHLETTLEPCCTAGLVYLILQAQRESYGESPESDELELAGLATIADVVPLTPFNWSLAHHGLKAMPETVNRGLSELIKVSGLHGLTRLTGRQVAFKLIPRLNAAGRMRGAEIALQLLQADDPVRARERALALEQLNNERKHISEVTARAAVLQAEEFKAAYGVALYDPAWHPGVLGIIAARVAELIDKPVIVVTDSPHDPEVLSGSVRSANGIDIVAALKECSDVLVSYGGHAAAAGVKVSAGRLDDFRDRWSEVLGIAVHHDEKVNGTDLPRVAIAELTEQFEEEMWRLAPFGPLHPAPRCVLNECRVERVSYMGRDKTHLNIILGDGKRQVRVAGFNMSHLYQHLRAGSRVWPLIEIEPDNWNNRYTIMLRLIGLMEHDATSRNN